MPINDVPSSGRAKRYSSIKTRLYLCSILAQVGSFAFFYFFISAPAFDLSFDMFSALHGAVLIYGTLFLAFIYIVSLPVRIFSSFYLERIYALSKRTFLSWASDEAKSAALSFIISMGCILFFFLSLRYFPEAWWLICALCWILFTVVLAKLTPVLLIPLFYKYQSIENGDLKRKISSLAERCGIKIMDIKGIDLSSKTVKANAALVGTGRTRKVILADTLMSGSSPGEILAVTAHEFAHHVMGHIPKLILLSSFLSLAGFYLLSRMSGLIASISGSDGLYDPRVLPVLFFLAFIFHLCLAPLTNYVSRRFERQADAFSLKVTNDPESFITVMDGLARTNLADRDPSLIKKIFLYGHPPINERIKYASKRLDAKKSVGDDRI